MPVDLACSVKSCIHNRHSACTAQAIQVRGVGTREANHTYCNTYSNSPGIPVVSAMEHILGVEKSLGGSAGNRTDIETADEFLGAAKGQGARHIFCTGTDCAYNDKFTCKAQAVHIGGQRPGEIQCNTFTV